MSVLWFGLFVILYLAFSIISFLLIVWRIQQKYVTPGGFFVQFQIDTLLSLTFFIFSLYLLAGYFSISLIMLFILALEVSGIVTTVVFWVLEPSPSRWMSQLVDIIMEFGKRHPWVAKGQNLLSVLAFLGYAIAAGLFYFSLTGDQLTVRVFQLQIIFLMVGYVMSMWTNFGLLLARSADENARGHVFVRFFGWMFPLGFYLAIAFWAFQESPGVKTAEIGQGLPLQLSPLIIAVLVSLFLLFAVVPYIIGARRGKQFRIQLHNKQKDYVDSVISLFRLPTPVADTPAVASQLEEMSEKLFRHLVDETKNSKVDLPESELRSLLGEAIRNPDTMPSEDFADDVIERIQPIVATDQNLRDLDQHYRYLRWLRELIQQVSQSKDELDKLMGEDQVSERQFEQWQQKETWRHGWLETFDDNRKRVDKVIQTEQSTKPPVLASVTAVISMAVSLFIDNVAGWAWELFQSSL